MFDPDQVYRIVSTGGPPAIFLLLVVIGLLLARRLIVVGELNDYKAWAREELARRDQVIDKLTALNERQQTLFDEFRGLLRDDLIPMLRDQSRGRR